MAFNFYFNKLLRKSIKSLQIFQASYRKILNTIISIANLKNLSKFMLIWNRKYRLRQKIHKFVNKQKIEYEYKIFKKWNLEYKKSRLYREKLKLADCCYFNKLLVKSINSLKFVWKLKKIMKFKENLLQNIDFKYTKQKYYKIWLQNLQKSTLIKKFVKKCNKNLQKNILHSLKHHILNSKTQSIFTKMLIKFLQKPRTKLLKNSFTELRLYTKKSKLLKNKLFRIIHQKESKLMKFGISKLRINSMQNIISQRNSMLNKIKEIEIKNYENNQYNEMYLQNSVSKIQAELSQEKDTMQKIENKLSKTDLLFSDLNIKISETEIEISKKNDILYNKNINIENAKLEIQNLAQNLELRNSEYMQNLDNLSKNQVTLKNYLSQLSENAENQANLLLCIKKTKSALNANFNFTDLIAKKQSEIDILKTKIANAKKILETGIRTIRGKEERTMSSSFDLIGEKAKNEVKNHVKMLKQNKIFGHNASIS